MINPFTAFFETMAGWFGTVGAVFIRPGPFGWGVLPPRRVFGVFLMQVLFIFYAVGSAHAHPFTVLWIPVVTAGRFLSISFGNTRRFAVGNDVHLHMWGAWGGYFRHFLGRLGRLDTYVAMIVFEPLALVLVGFLLMLTGLGYAGLYVWLCAGGLFVLSFYQASGDVGRGFGVVNAEHEAGEQTNKTQGGARVTKQSRFHKRGKPRRKAGK